MLFGSGITITERPSLIPCYFFLGLACILLFGMRYRRDHPNPWYQCKSYQELFNVLFMNKYTPHYIKANENLEKSQEADAKFDELMARFNSTSDEKKQNKVRITEAQMKNILAICDAAANAEDTNVENKGKLDPVKFIYYPFQKFLLKITRILRFLKNIVTWQESYYSFIITSVCLALSFACYFIPWGWIIKVVSRSFVWVCLGPWMKLVDIRNKRKKKRSSSTKVQKMTELVDKSRFRSMLYGESEIKMKAHKSSLFGNLSIHVPIIKQERFLDIPLPESTATPCGEMVLRRKIVIPHQDLKGNLIPVANDTSFWYPEVHESQLKFSKRIILVTAIATWFFVPFLLDSIRFYFSSIRN